MMFLLRCKIVLAACAIASIGCGRSEYAPVSGTITLNQKPLAGAHVSFEPTEGTTDETATAVTDEEGHFELARAGKRGARVGKNRVLITTVTADTMQDERSALPRDLVPADYQDGSLTFEIPIDGTDQANFDLISRRR